MDNRNDSYVRLRKCKKCGGGTRMNRAPLPSDACSICGAVYSKVEEALDSTATERRVQPIAGWTLFMLVSGAAVLFGAVAALIGWEGLALALIGTAIYVLKIAKDVANTTSSSWLRRFLAQPEQRGNSWERKSTAQRIIAFVSVYAILFLLFIFVAVPFLLFILGGPR
jgi:hypothetical protein